MNNFWRGRKIFNGEATETRRGEWFKFKLSGETYFPGGSSFYLGGAAFQRGRYWEGVLDHTACRSGNAPRFAFLLITPVFYKTNFFVRSDFFQLTRAQCVSDGRNIYMPPLLSAQSEFEQFVLFRRRKNSLRTKNSLSGKENRLNFFFRAFLKS